MSVSLPRPALLVLTLGLLVPVSGQDLVLNEFLALNTSGLADETGTPTPWIEIHNGGEQDAAVGGHLVVLADATEPFRIPAGTTIPAGGQLVIFADGEVDDGPLHAPFVLTDFANTLSLRTPADVVLDAVDYPDQRPDVATGRLDDGHPRWVSLLDATPGASNHVPFGAHRRFDAFDPWKHTLRHGVSGVAEPGAGLVFTVTEAPADLSVLWYFSLDTLAFNFPSGQSVLLVGLEFPAITLPLDSQGELTFAVHVPNTPAFAGLTLYTQAFVLQQYFKGSNAVQIVMGE